MRRHAGFRSETGQATAEYILMLMVAVSVFLIVSRNFLKPVLTRFQNQLAQKIDASLFGGDLHHLNVGN